jgi:hypothetical protein
LQYIAFVRIGMKFAYNGGRILPPGITITSFKVQVIFVAFTAESF